MEHKTYTRLREVMAALRIDLTDAALARKFNILDQHITNWKKRGIPKDFLIDLSDEWKFRAKYVRDGTGEMFDAEKIYPNSPEAQMLKSMQEMDLTTKHQVVKIGNSLIEPTKKDDGTKSQ